MALMESILIKNHDAFTRDKKKTNNFIISLKNLEVEKKRNSFCKNLHLKVHLKIEIVFVVRRYRKS